MAEKQRRARDRDKARLAGRLAPERAMPEEASAKGVETGAGQRVAAAMDSAA